MNLYMKNLCKYINDVYILFVDFDYRPNLNIIIYRVRVMFCGSTVLANCYKLQIERINDLYFLLRLD